MRNPIVATMVGAFLGAGVVVGCSPDAPSHDKAVAVIAELCADDATALAAIGLPTDVFALSAVAEQAFEVASHGIAQLDGEGLAAMDDDADVQAYLRGATAMNNALASLSGRAEFEDVPGMETALTDADAASADLDAAAAALDLDVSCGGAAWRGRVLDDARTVVGLERDLMTPTGDYTADVANYCSRYERRLGLAPEPVSIDDTRRRALVVRAATQQFGARLALVTPPPDLADAHAGLVAGLADLTNLLESSETLAIDGAEQQLRDLVDDADGRLAEIEAQVALTGVHC